MDVPVDTINAYLEALITAAPDPNAFWPDVCAIRFERARADEKALRGADLDVFPDLMVNATRAFGQLAFLFYLSGAAEPDPVYASSRAERFKYMFGPQFDDAFLRANLAQLHARVPVVLAGMNEAAKNEHEEDKKKEFAQVEQINMRYNEIFAMIQDPSKPRPSMAQQFLDKLKEDHPELARHFTIKLTPAATASAAAPSSSSGALVSKRTQQRRKLQQQKRT